jgi:hypothetical protein
MTTKANLGNAWTQAALLCALLLLAGCAQQTDTGEVGEEAASAPAAEEAQPEASLEQREREIVEREEDVVARGIALREQEIAERERDVAAREAALRNRVTSPAEKAAESQAPSYSRPEPPAQAAPAMQAVRLTVPTMTGFEVEVLDALSSETSQLGDRFRARIVRDILVADRVAVPVGSEVSGAVTEVQSSKKIGGQARLTLDFDRLQLPSGETSPLHATLTEAGKKQTKKDAATIGGATAGGALLGRVLGHDKDKATIIGAVVGAAVGTTIAAKNPGDPVFIDPGTVVALSMEEPVTIVLDGGERRFEQYASNR